MEADIKSIWHYLSFDKKEVRDIFISSIFISIIVAFRKWGDSTLNIKDGITNTIFAFVISLTIIVISSSVSKAHAIRAGNLGKFIISFEGLLVGIILAFITYGRVWFFPFGIMLYNLESKLRIGRFPFHFQYRDASKSTFAGIFSIIVMGFIFRYFYTTTGLELFRYAMQIAVGFVIMSILPIPKNNGITMFYESRLRYAFYIGILLSMVLFLYLINNFWLSLFLSFLIGLGMIYVWTKNFEKHFS